MFAAPSAGAEADGAPGAPTEAARDEAPSEAGGVRPHGATYPFSGGVQVQSFPSGSFYPRYLADPRQIMMKALVLHVLKTDIDETDSPLLEFAMGGWVDVLRFHPKGDPSRGLQISVAAGFIGRFDQPANYDAIGWDGYYSLRFAYKVTPRLMLKLADQHDSAHVADEYIRKTGRKRITYTRDEIALGAIYQLPGPLPLRLYGEVGWAAHLGNKHLRRWRTQTGAEWEYRQLYAAVDATFWQERAFRPTTTAQIGVKSERYPGGRRYGIALQFENGRTLLGEFYLAKNRTLGAGFWADL